MGITLGHCNVDRGQYTSSQKRTIREQKVRKIERLLYFFRMESQEVNICFFYCVCNVKYYDPIFIMQDIVIPNDNFIYRSLFSKFLKTLGREKKDFQSMRIKKKVRMLLEWTLLPLLFPKKNKKT